MNAKDKKQISEFWDTICEARDAKLVLIKNSAKALAQKYTGICGKYQLIGAENSPEGLFFLCEQISRI